MNIFNEVTKWINEIKIFEDWHELLTLFEKQSSSEPYGWELGVSSCLAVGGTQADAVPLVAAYGCILNSILAIDDILDHDPNGLHTKLGVEKTVNISAAFQAAGLQVINHTMLPLDKKMAVLISLNQMAYQTALGQSLDVENPKTEEEYWRVVKGKSSPFHSAAMYCGAIFGGASMELAEQIGSFGSLYGEIIQINDDLKDTMEKDINVDWLYGKMTLPILYANIVDYPDKERFLFIQKNISHPGNLKEAQEILLKCGAVSYSLDQLLVRYKLLSKNLGEMALINEDEIKRLINRIINPFEAVMKEIGLSDEEILKIISLN